MLGRLEMSVDECIDAYSELAADVFGEKLHRFPATFRGKTQSRFNSARLESAIRKVIVKAGAPETALFNDGMERGCRTFVCSIDRNTKDIVRLRSYSLPEEPAIRATVYEAALATSAATTFFDPVSIGDRSFADGGFGADNPVDEVEGEAANVWCSETRDLKPLVKCFISIGTGNPGKKPFQDSLLKFLSQTVVQIATETEATERKFIARWARHLAEKRYFRFNVEQGLQDIGLEEYKKKGAIEAASEAYLVHMAQKFRVRDCVQNLQLKQNLAADNLSYMINEYNEQHIVDLRTLPKEAPWIVPFQKNTQFVGRASELAQIDTLLANDSRCERVAVVGLGGVGKTQIVLEFVHQWREKHPNCAVFWIPVTNVASMLAAHLEVGRQLQIPNVEENKAEVEKLVQHRLSQESSGRWLLVFDNADDIDVWTKELRSSAGSQRRIEYLPKSKHGSILFTTRSRKAAVKLTGKNLVSVSEMDNDTAKSLLRKSLPVVDQDLLADDQATADLLLKLTYLPLAIVQAAAYINENQISLSEYATLLDDTEQNIIDILSEEFEDEGRYPDTKNPIATTWFISFEQIRTRDPLAAEYLSFMSCVHAKDIPQSLLLPAHSAKQAVDAIGMLSAYSFVKKHKTDQLLDLHRLVHLATRNWLRAENSLHEWAIKALERLEEVFPRWDGTNRALQRLYLPHAKYALEAATKEPNSVKEALLRKYAYCTFDDGRYKESEQAWLQMRDIFTKEFGEDHPDTLVSVVNLAATYARQHRWEETEALCKKLIRIYKTTIGSDHSDILRIMALLANAYMAQHQWKDAEVLLVPVVEIRKTKLGADHIQTMVSISQLALIYIKRRKFKEAEELQIPVIERMTRLFGSDHLERLTCINNVALAYQDQGKWKEAEELQRPLVETSTQLLGADHPTTLTFMYNLAFVLKFQGFLDRAIPLIEDCWKRQVIVLGTQHPDTILSQELLKKWRSESY